MLQGDDVTFYVSLIDGRTGNQLWGDQYTRRIGNPVTLQREIALDVGDRLQAHLSGADRGLLTNDYTANGEAYQLYLRGRFHCYKLTGPDRDLFRISRLRRVHRRCSRAVRPCADCTYVCRAQFLLLADVYMPDHLHMLLAGISRDVVFKPTMTLLRQRSAVAFRRAFGEPLWQDGYFERVLRDDSGFDSGSAQPAHTLVCS